MSNANDKDKTKKEGKNILSINILEAHIYLTKEEFIKVMEAYTKLSDAEKAKCQFDEQEALRRLWLVI